MKRFPRFASCVRFICAASFALGITCGTALAHPLGNFTINHLSKLTLGRDSVRVRYVLDMAEIPTYAAMRERNAEAKFDRAELRSWANAEAALILTQLDVRVGDTAVPLRADDVSARLRPGAGGLPTLYLVVSANGKFAPSAQARPFSYEDRSFAGRLGWHDVAVAPQTEPTHELLSYPNTLLGSPRTKTAVAGTLATNGALALAPDAPAAAAVSAASVPSAVRSNTLADMLAKGTSDPWFVLLTLLMAVALGALHALEPGHGKTLLAVSLVGARATASQAAILAGSLTVAHTAGVLALGLAIMALKGAFVPETIYPWITLLSGVVIAVVGARAIARQFAQRRKPALAKARIRIKASSRPHAHAHAHAHGHTHSHGGHAHSHGHASLSDEAHARAHAIPGSAPLRFGPTVWAAMSGGIAPCPAALVVLFAALAQNAVVYGIIAIVFFSFGLAATLTGLGIGVVHGASWLSNRPQFDRVVKFGPIVSAFVIATIGAVMVGQGAAENGFSVSPLAIAGLTALAIGAYAFTQPRLRRRAQPA